MFSDVVAFVYTYNNHFKLILACDEGTYGFDCNETCGHCHDASQCSNTNGTCLNGCDASYKGDMCESRE